MRVYRLNSNQLVRTLTPTRMCEGILEYFKYHQYTVVSIVKCSKIDTKRLPVLLSCIEHELNRLDDTSFLAKDENDVIYWCRKDFTTFHSISDTGFFNDFKQIFDCYQMLQTVKNQGYAYTEYFRRDK
ncbi:hypothetical protein COO03_04625 [Bacillus sp. AFS098217]|uniref:hypothetical protein n=1 Tax=Bacillus sp. AFS098217 TaxID=2033868 RepID=UPI000BEE0EF2|nr:hypothetical protein [Bacillus sp. AFS098217]PEB54534.1 hypothetical protein COO03_04625 [Bacillus sp. AFS098217]